MVRCPPRQARPRDTNPVKPQAGAKPNPVKRRHGPPRRIGAARIMQRKERLKRGKPRGRRPFVQIPQKRRGPFRQMRQFRHQGDHLTLPVPAAQAQMRGGDAQRPGRPRKIQDQRAARLQPRKGQADQVGHRPAPTQQNRVAVPAQADGVDRHRGRGHADRICHDIMRQCRAARTKTQIGLLQGDDVGVQIAQDIDDAVRVASPVQPDAFMDVVADQPDQVRAARRWMRHLAMIPFRLWLGNHLPILYVASP